MEKSHPGILQFEKNSLQIARLGANWLEGQVEEKAQRAQNGPMVSRTSASDSRSPQKGNSVSNK
jgi:hypothetical protein